MIVELAVYRPHRSAHRRDELLHGAHRLQLAERLAALHRIADVRQLHRDYLAERDLPLIRDANLGAVGFSAYPQVVVGEAQDGDRITLATLLFLFGGHRALLTELRFAVSSPDLPAAQRVS